MTYKRNQVVINIGSKNYWISLVAIDFEGHSRNECALVQRDEGSFMGVRLIPLACWLQGNFGTDETVVELNGIHNDYYWGEDITEGEILSVVIEKATKYVNQFRGVLLEVE